MRSLAVDGYTAAEVLARLESSGRTVAFAYDVLDSSGVLLGRAGQVVAGQVENNALARNVKRTAKIRVRDDGSINYLSDRIRPMFRLRMPDESVQVTRDAGPKPYDEVVLADGPVGYWRLGESSGTVARDSSGHGRDGTYVDAPTLGVAGALTTDANTAVTFPAESHVTLADVKAVYSAGTFECWVDTRQWAADATQHGLYQNSTGWSNQANGVSLFRWAAASSDASRFYFRVVNPGAAIQDISAPWRDYFGTADGWHHVVGTWSAAGMFLYVDGVQVATRTCDPPTAASVNPATQISRGHAYGGRGHTVDEAAVYDRALTADEVAEHYRAGRARGPRLTETVSVVEQRWAEWPLGVFVLSSAERNVDGTGTTRDLECYDLGVILLEDAVTDRYVVTAGTLYTDAVRTLLDAAGITSRFVTESTATLPADRDWPPGTPRGTIVDDLLGSINYRSLYFDAAGFAVAEPYVSPADRGEEHTYAVGSRSVLVPEISVGFDLFTVPNSWVAYVSEADRPVLTSTYTNSNPDSPTSTVSRGRTIVDHRKVDAASQSALDALVSRIAFEASQVLEVVEFDTATMPHHEDADVLRVTYPAAGLGARYTEHTWSLPLEVGAKMRHRVRRVVTIS